MDAFLGTVILEVQGKIMALGKTGHAAGLARHRKLVGNKLDGFEHPLTVWRPQQSPDSSKPCYRSWLAR